MFDILAVDCKHHHKLLLINIRTMIKIDTDLAGESGHLQTVKVLKNIEANYTIKN